MANLKQLFADAEPVELRGRQVLVRSVALRHFELYGRSASALVEVLASASVQKINHYAATHTGELKKMLRVTTNLNWFALWRLSASDAVRLAAEVVRVNSGFFAEALPDLARALNGAPLSSD